MMSSSVDHNQKRIEAAGEPDVHDESRFTIVSAKDFKPGDEAEVLESVHNLLYSSMGILTHNINNAAITTSGWFSNWRNMNNNDMDNLEQKMCEDVKMGRSGDWSPNDMDGVVDSMQYVVEVMQTYQARAHKAATDFLDEREVTMTPEQRLTSSAIDRAIDRVPEAGRDNNRMWNLDPVRDMSTAEFLLGSLMPNNSRDEYPEGSQPLFPMSPLGPTADAFLGSLSSLLGVRPRTQEKTVTDIINDPEVIESKIEYLQNVETVSVAVHSQIEELDTILNNPTMAALYEIQENNSLNSVLTEDVEDQAHHPPLNDAAASYLRAARDKLAKYAALAEKILKDEVKCMVTAYACAPGKCGEQDHEDPEKEGLFFEGLRQHFNSDAYHIDFKSYLAAESSGVMQMMVLNTLHSSLFLRNVGDKCQKRVRIHVGKEVSVSICNLVMASLMNSKKNHRITEWGALLFSRHVRALHAYAYEFCRSADGTRDLLSKVELSALDAEPMDTNWERLFSALEILKLEMPEDFDKSKVHPLFTAADARRILRLRAEFSDYEIDKYVVDQEPKFPKRDRGKKSKKKSKQ